MASKPSAVQKRLLSAAAVAAAVALGLTLGCGTAAFEDAPSPAASATAQPADVSPPTAAEAAAATYSGIAEAGGDVTLVGGEWRGEPVAPGAAARPQVELVDMPPVTADFDDDGAEESAVLLAAGSGGSGVRLYLAVLGRRPHGVADLATVLVGDRVQVRGARHDGRLVVLDLVQASADDAMCCPGDLVTRAWRLEGGALGEVATEVTGRLTPAVMEDREWVLRAWDVGQPATSEPAVTLRYRDGMISGAAGCNHYSAAVAPGAAPGELTLGPVAATKRLCPAPMMSVETRFLALLGGVRKVGFLDGRLALTTTADGHVVTLLFEPSGSAVPG